MGGAMSSVVLSGDTSGSVTVTVPAVAGTNTVTIPATTGNVPVLPTGYTLGGGDTTRFKNRIINGDMRIDQRNAGASITPTTFTYTVDRFLYLTNVASKFAVQQNAGSVTPPAGFTNYLGFTSQSAYSSGSTDQFGLRQPIEGLNIADLGWGTANAKTVTLSFWVRSSLTGTFSGSIYNSAANRCYVFNYTISSANTWTQISVTIAGDTTGTWLTTNGIGMVVQWNLGNGSTFLGTAGSWGNTYYAGSTGSVSVVGTNGATFYITGVQLEVGSQATSFEYVDYTTQLQMCMRYYQIYTNPCARGVTGSATAMSRIGIPIQVQMRTAPTVSMTGTLYWFDGTAAGTITSLIAAYSTVNSLEIDASAATGTSAANRGVVLYINPPSGSLIGNSEL